MERTVYRSGGKRWLLVWRVDTMRGWKCQITRKCNSLKSWITSKAESLTIRDGYYASLLDKGEIKYQFRRIKSLLHRFSWSLNSNCTRSLPLVTFNACSLAPSLLTSKNLLYTRKKNVVSVFLLSPFLSSSALPFDSILLIKNTVIAGAYRSSLLLLINELEAGERTSIQPRRLRDLSLINSPSVSWRGVKRRKGKKKRIKKRYTYVWKEHE